MAPKAAPAPWLVAVIVKVAVLWPWKKLLPLWVLLMTRSGADALRVALAAAALLPALPELTAPAGSALVQSPPWSAWT